MSSVNFLQDNTAGPHSAGSSISLEPEAWFWQGPQRPEPRLRFILMTVADTCRIGIKDMDSPSRRSHVVRARHIAWSLAREFTRRGTPFIGVWMGDRDHATVIYGVRQVHRKPDYYEPELSAARAALTAWQKSHARPS